MNDYVPALLAVARLWLGWFLRPYLGEKAKNLATREDIDRVVRKTEDIKAEITGELWEKQNRWTFKRDLYIRLLENLGAAHRALDHLYDAETIHHVAEESESRKKWRADERAKLAESLETVHRTSAVASVVLNADALTALAKLESRLAKASGAGSLFDFLTEELEAVTEARDLLKTAAKTDLVLEAHP